MISLTWIQIYYLNGYIQIISITLTSILVVQFLWKETVYKRANNALKRLLRLNSSLCEDALFFYEDGSLVESTRSYAISSLKDYIQRILSSFESSKELLAWEQAVLNGTEYECLVYQGSDNRSQKFWILRTIPLLFDNKRYTQISLLDITQYYSSLFFFKKSYEQLQNFLDFAPFGLVYIKSNGNIIGINATLCEWLDQSKESLLGQPVNRLIEGDKHKESLITLRSKNPCKAFWFAPKTLSSPGIICRIDQYNFDLKTFEYSPIPSIVINHDRLIMRFNTAFETLVGDVSINQETILDTLIEEKDLLRSHLKKETQGAVLEIQLGSCHTTAYLSPIDHWWLIQFVDISEQKLLKQQFIQSQKMHAVGQLAGGIAHDFNNLLTAMLGFCDLLLQRYLPNDPSYSDIIQIKQNACRASNLVRQLLAFSKQQTLQARVVHLIDILADLSNLLRRLIGSNIDLKVSHGRDLWPIKVDPGQLEQVIINLAVNARDAMANGGTLLIQTENFSCRLPKRLGSDSLPPGDYVQINVIDSGYGIAKEHINHIFEPFFSTKALGSGTGLGLSTVYGIIHQTGGAVGVTSIVGKGTTFTIFLPRYIGSQSVQTQTSDTVLQDLSGQETILLVEDEDAVRLFAARALKEKGYSVLEARSGEEALELINSGQQFDLLITDVVMPKIDGPTLYSKIREKFQSTKVLFISGYAEDTFRKNLNQDERIYFLAKPFTLKDLITKVKEVLSQSTH